MARTDATGYHLWEWRSVFERALGHRCHYLAAPRSASGIAGVLPLVEVRSRIFGRALSSLPYVNYGGVLAATDEARRVADRRSRTHRGGARAFLCRAASPAAHVLRPAEPHAQGDDAAPPEGGRRGDVEWARSQGAQPGPQRPRRASWSTVSGGAELLDDFYAVFARNMRDLGTPVYSRSLFATILANFPERGADAPRAAER